MGGTATHCGDNGLGRVPSNVTHGAFWIVVAIPDRGTCTLARLYLRSRTETQITRMKKPWIYHYTKVRRPSSGYGWIVCVRRLTVNGGQNAVQGTDCFSAATPSPRVGVATNLVPRNANECGSSTNSRHVQQLRVAGELYPEMRAEDFIFAGVTASTIAVPPTLSCSHDGLRQAN